MHGMFELMNRYIVGTHPFVKGVSMCFGGRGGGGFRTSKYVGRGSRRFFLRKRGTYRNGAGD